MPAHERRQLEQISRWRVGAVAANRREDNLIIIWNVVAACNGVAARAGVHLEGGAGTGFPVERVARDVYSRFQRFLVSSMRSWETWCSHGLLFALHISTVGLVPMGVL